MKENQTRSGIPHGCAQDPADSPSGIQRGKGVDPLGGSNFIESLTDEMEQRIWKRIQEIEAMGDPADLSDKGWFRTFSEETMGEIGGAMRLAYNCPYDPHGLIESPI